MAVDDGVRLGGAGVSAGGVAVTSRLRRIQPSSPDSITKTLTQTAPLSETSGSGRISTRVPLKREER